MNAYRSQRWPPIRRCQAGTRPPETGHRTGGWRERAGFSVTVAALGAILLGCSQPVPQAAGKAIVDSAQMARSAWREGLEADARGDSALAWHSVHRAAMGWPEQSAYIRGLAVLAARHRDTTQLVLALDRLATMEVGLDTAEDPALARMSAGALVQAALQRLQGATRPRPESRAWAALPDTTIFAEGLDADLRTSTVYVTSLRHRTIYAVDSAGGVRDLQVGRAPGVSAIFAVRFDPARSVLWAATSGLPAAEGYQPADSAIAALLRIDPVSGAIQARYPAPAATPHVLGDIALGPEGDVFVSDSRTPALYRLRPGTETMEWFSDPLFHSLQGVAPTPDGRWVYLADYSHGLLRWDLRTGTVTRLTVPAGATSLGLDGILLDGRSIVGIQNGLAPPRVVRFTLDQAGERVVATEVLDRHLPLADEPTNVTRLNNDLIYIANSQWEKYADDGSRRPGTRLGPTVLLALPLR